MRLSTLVPLALTPACYGQLHSLAQAKGKLYFGSATDNSEFSDSTYMSILKSNEFGSITPGQTQKWTFVEHEQNSFTFAQGDAIIGLAQSTKKLVRCHNLVWYQELPSWVSSGTWTNSTLTAALKHHITQVVNHYKGKCYSWDVVNEALNDDGTFRSNVFLENIGPEYIPIAFDTAAKADPDVRLYYNDFNIEFSGAKATAAQKLVRSLKDRGIKIDGVGLQAHFIVGQTPSADELTAILDSFISEGVEVAYTELDIRFSSLPPSSSGLDQQSTDYQNVVTACLNAGQSCVGITLWDFTDKYSWVPTHFSASGDACPWDKDFKRKAAYCGIVKALGGPYETSS